MANNKHLLSNWIVSIWVIMVAFFVIDVGISPAVYADDQKANSAIDYSIQKITPDAKQVSETSPFYDLLVKPGDELQIQAKLQNSSKEPVVIYSEIFTTYTNNNGQISYTSKAKKYDKSLDYKISDFAKVSASDINKEVPADSDTVVTADIKIPEDIEDGVYLGSWYFEKKGQEKNNGEENTGIAINNKYSYALAVKLTVNKEIAKPHLNLLTITTGTTNYKKSIQANIQNDQPAIVSKLKIDADVMKKGKFDVLYQNKMEDIIMAPNSQFSFPIYLKKDKMKPGDYTMRLTVSTEDTKWKPKTWEWKKDFTITKADADEANKTATNDPKPDNNWLIYVIIALAIVVLILFVVYIVKKKEVKRKEASKRKRKKKKSK